MTTRMTLLLLSCVFLVGESQAKSWRGIVPLKSTRADVERLLGKDDKWGRYQFADERGSIHYRENPCVGAYRPLEKDNCECMVSKDTVVSIFVTLEVSKTFSSLHPDKTKFQRRPFNAGPAYVEYINLDEGVIYSVDESDDEIVSINYVPAEADCKELIARNTPAYRNSWRGIVPLHSNRADVERLLGSPAKSSDSVYDYQTDHELVGVRYSTGTCKSSEDAWNTPAGVIIEFSVSPIPAFEIRGLRLDPSRFQRAESPPLEYGGKLVNYTDEANGITIRARDDGRVEKVMSITYSPSRKDEQLRCTTRK